MGKIYSAPKDIWAEFVSALSDYSKFRGGKGGTRFDRWLPSNKGKSPVRVGVL